MSGRGPRWIKKPTFTVQLAGHFSETIGYATINGVKYAEETTLQVLRHQTVSVTVGSGSSTNAGKCEVTLNGEIVQSGAGTYELTVDSGMVITFEGPHAGVQSAYYYTCSITTK